MQRQRKKNWFRVLNPKRRLTSHTHRKRNINSVFPQHFSIRRCVSSYASLNSNFLQRTCRTRSKRAAYSDCESSNAVLGFYSRRIVCDKIRMQISNFWVLRWQVAFRPVNVAIHSVTVGLVCRTQWVPCTHCRLVLLLLFGRVIQWLHRRQLGWCSGCLMHCRRWSMCLKTYGRNSNRLSFLDLCILTVGVGDNFRL